MVVVVDPAEVIFDKDKFLIYGRFTRQFRVQHNFNQHLDSTFRIQEMM